MKKKKTVNKGGIRTAQRKRTAAGAYSMESSILKMLFSPVYALRNGQHVEIH
jgi:hypothetical protein